MRVVVKFQHTIRADVRRWRELLGPTPAEQRERFDVYIAALREQFEKHGGYPPGAVANHRVDPTLYAWQFTSDAVVQFVVREHPPAPRHLGDIGRVLKRWLTPVVRTVLVTGLAPPPPGSTGEAPRR